MGPCTVHGLEGFEILYRYYLYLNECQSELKILSCSQLVHIIFSMFMIGIKYQIRKRLLVFKNITMPHI
jgi:hypothetical protein